MGSHVAGGVLVCAMACNQIACQGCGFCGGDLRWDGYTCPVCGALHVGLYRAEHRDPKRAKGMSLLEIAWECRQAGMVVKFAAGAV